MTVHDICTDFCDNSVVFVELYTNQELCDCITADNGGGCNSDVSIIYPDTVTFCEA